nr:hypothetical protein [Fimbriimonadaceae bacterium]
EHRSHRSVFEVYLNSLRKLPLWKRSIYALAAGPDPVLVRDLLAGDYADDPGQAAPGTEDEIVAAAEEMRTKAMRQILNWEERYLGKGSKLSSDAKELFLFMLPFECLAIAVPEHCLDTVFGTRLPAAIESLESHGFAYRVDDGEDLEYRMNVHSHLCARLLAVLESKRRPHGSSGYGANWLKQVIKVDLRGHIDYRLGGPAIATWLLSGGRGLESHLERVKTGLNWTGVTKPLLDALDLIEGIQALSPNLIDGASLNLFRESKLKEKRRVYLGLNLPDLPEASQFSEWRDEWLGLAAMLRKDHLEYEVGYLYYLEGNFKGARAAFSDSIRSSFSLIERFASDPHSISEVNAARSGLNLSTTFSVLLSVIFKSWAKRAMRERKDVRGALATIQSIQEDLYLALYNVYAEMATESSVRRLQQTMTKAAAVANLNVRLGKGAETLVLRPEWYGESARPRLIEQLMSLREWVLNFSLMRQVIIDNPSPVSQEFLDHADLCATFGNNESRRRWQALGYDGMFGLAGRTQLTPNPAFGERH